TDGLLSSNASQSLHPPPCAASGKNLVKTLPPPRPSLLRPITYKLGAPPPVLSAVTGAPTGHTLLTDGLLSSNASQSLHPPPLAASGKNLLKTLPPPRPSLSRPITFILIAPGPALIAVLSLHDALPILTDGLLSSNASQSLHPPPCAASGKNLVKTLPPPRP